MRLVKGALLAFALATVSAAQSVEPPIGETRLTVHTLLREDIFAGFLDDNMDRVARAERNLNTLLKERPAERANLVAWRGGIELLHAVRAHEAGKAGEFATNFEKAKNSFAEAGKISTGTDGVAPITGGSYAVFADRLPQEHRAAAWQQAYDSYSLLWKAQNAQLEKMPLHFKGEVLAGMAQSAQRTGRADESAQFVDRMLTMLAGTAFEKTAREWKDDPKSAASSNLTCKNCHGPGRLAVRLAALNK